MSLPEASPAGHLDKQNPLIALKVLRYVSKNPDAFHSKWKDLKKAKYRTFIKFLATECGATKYSLRAGGGVTITTLKNLHGNMKKW